MRYLALCTDYDGTIATHGSVDEPTIDALARLKDSGRKLIMVTGREMPDLISVFPRLDLFDLVVAENLISYDGKPWMYSVNLLEFRGDKVEHERIYIMDGWEAPEWRTPWRAETPADPPPPPP